MGPDVATPVIPRGINPDRRHRARALGRRCDYPDDHQRHAGNLLPRCAGLAMGRPRSASALRCDVPFTSDAARASQQPTTACRAGRWRKPFLRRRAGPGRSPAPRRRLRPDGRSPDGATSTQLVCLVRNVDDTHGAGMLGRPGARGRRPTAADKRDDTHDEHEENTQPIEPPAVRRRRRQHRLLTVDPVLRHKYSDVAASRSLELYWDFVGNRA